MTITVLLFLVGLFLIIKGGDVFVDRAVWIAEVFNIPKFIIGATIVSIATTLPEILVSTIATFSGNNSIAMATPSVCDRQYSNDYGYKHNISKFNNRNQKF